MQILVAGDNHQGVAIGTALQRANLDVTVLPFAQTTGEALSHRRYRVIVFACPRTVCTGHCPLKQLRACGNRTPFLAVTTQRQEKTPADCIAAGATGLITRPYRTSQLVAWVRALLDRAADTGSTCIPGCSCALVGLGRRPDREQSNANGAPGQPKRSGDASVVSGNCALPPASDEPSPNTLRFADLTLDLLARRATRAGKPIELRPREFVLLNLLMAKPGQTCTWELIFAQGWGSSPEDDSNAVEMTVRRLRAKIDDGAELKLIHNAYGVGYVMREA